MSGPLTIEFEFRNKRYNDAQVGLNAFARHLNSGIDRLGPVLSKQMRNFLNSVALALSKRHGAGWPGGTTDNSLSKRSGKLVQSIKESVRVTGTSLKDIEGAIGGAFYARIHEFGGTIRAKNVKYLTIPLPAALNVNGTPKKRSAREWDRTFVIRSKKGNLLIVQKVGKNIVPLYVLKTSVTIKPRLKMGDTLRTGVPHFVDKAMAAMAKELVSDRNG